jgi:hypothetical protein
VIHANCTSHATALATNWIVEVHLLGILVGFIDRL